MKVLAVDDSQAILDLIKDTLTAHKFEVETASNGALALDKYTRLNPDIVTLDLAMPIMDGYDTLKRLLALDKDALVIMLTANDQQRTLENCLERGAVGYIVKPFSPMELVSIIKISLSAGADKNVAVLFARVCNKIQSLLQKLTTDQVSVILTEVTVIRQHAATHVLHTDRDLAQIRVVPNTIGELHIQEPANTTGFATEFGGQQSGMIVSFAENKALMEAMGMPKNMTENNSATDKITEFFNIFNQRIISNLGDSTHLILTPQPATTYDRNNYKGISFGKEITKSKFDITIGQKKSTIQTQLWFNTSQVFRG